MWGRRVPLAKQHALFSATLSLALSVYLCQYGTTVSASDRTACPVGPTLRQSGSCHGNESPLHLGFLSPPFLSVWKNVVFFFNLLGVGLPCRLIFCQFWLCEEAQCVYLRRHRGSPRRSGEMDLTYIYRAFHPKEAKYTFFSSVHGTFSKIDHMIRHKASLKKFKKIEIISSIFSDHKGLKLETNPKGK